jgi:hypothetical protein
MTTTASIPQGTVVASAASGANLPLASMSVAKAAVLFLGASAVTLVAMRMAFGNGKEIPVIRVDALEVVKIYVGYQVINIPVKLLAFHFHGHSLSQAVLTFT